MSLFLCAYRFKWIFISDITLNGVIFTDIYNNNAYLFWSEGGVTIFEPPAVVAKIKGYINGKFQDGWHP